MKFFQTKEDPRRVIRDTCKSKIVKSKTGAFYLKQTSLTLSLVGRAFLELEKQSL